MATTVPQHDSHHQAQRHELLIATTNHHQRTFHAGQLDADGHTVYEADSTTAAVAKLSAHPIDVLILRRLQRPADAPALLRTIRAGEHPHIHPGQPVITLGTTDELTVLRAYESGSDHHLPDHTRYVLLRAVLTSVMRCTVEAVTSRHLHVAGMHTDLAARTVEVAGPVVRLSPMEFELLVAFAADPLRVFSRDELGRCIWPLRDQRTDDRQSRLPAAYPPRRRRRRSGARQLLGPRLVADHRAVAPISPTRETGVSWTPENACHERL